ncbi:MerR family transcriptional regulator [Anaerocolumna sedimenticola]|uniref:MerR family transcriptional regulator n=1 Tax=Anaerocolumna sedimenticola TaxID=2696063 RepID=A0A6P1TRU5_9FIRM|nr:MerR family transcriptional regulator [Anaerocolumna sedimenticola]QHQ62969.1 MerR family transcriptional regulator [Anaerocolumna sedimenticola]
MGKYKATPEGYMTVGEVAKKMGVTVRTLQYYDEESLLSPSLESEGGRRLYTDKDVIKLHQILSLKHLGFSLDDIKNRLSSLDTPTDVARALTEQASTIREKMEALSESLKEIEMLQAEVLQMQTVDFKKYADIIVNLQMKNELYWLIKHFDDKTLEHFRSHFDKDSGPAMLETFTHLQDEAIQLQKDGVPPESEKGQNYAKEFWKMVMEFTGGDISMLTKLMEIESFNSPDNKWKQKQAMANSFIEPALGAYFTALGYNPLEEGAK